MTKTVAYRHKLSSGINYRSGQNSFTIPYQGSDTSADFSAVAGVNVLFIEANAFRKQPVILQDETDTFSVSFGVSAITVTWHHQSLSIGDTDDLLFVFGLLGTVTLPDPVVGDADKYVKVNGAGTGFSYVTAANLDALRTLVGAADRLAYFTALDTLALATFTATGRSIVAAATTGAAQDAIGATATGKSLITAADAAAVRTAAGATTVGSALITAASAVAARQAVALVMDSVSGLIVSRTGNDTWAVSLGEIRDDTDTYNIVLTAALTGKTISGAWAAGSGTGGRTGGAEAASQARHVFLIYKPSDGSVDAIADDSYTSPTLPSGYTHKRYLRTLFNDASSHLNIDAHSGDYVHLDAPLLVVNDSSITAATYETATLPVPPHAICMLQFVTGDTGTKADWRVGLKKGGAALPTAANGWANTQQIPNITSGIGLEPGGKGLVQVSATSTIEYGVQNEATIADVVIYLHGFFMPTRRNPLL